MRLATFAAATCVVLVGVPALGKGKKTAPPPPPPSADLPLDDDTDLELAVPPPPVAPAPEKKQDAPPPEKKVEPAPVPAAPAPVAVAPKLDEPLGLRLSPTVGFGQVSETTLDTTAPVFAFGLGAQYDFNRSASLSLDVGDRIYSRTYATREPDLAGDGPQTLDVGEHEIRADLLFAYDLAPLLKLAPERVHLAPVVGLTSRFFENEALPVVAAGVGVGARASVRLSDQLEIGGEGVWTYDLAEPALKLNDALDSALGGPLHYASFGGWIGLRLAPKTRFSLGYAGEVVTLDHSYRLMHGLSFTFDVLL